MADPKALYAGADIDAAMPEGTTPRLVGRTALHFSTGAWERPERAAETATLLMDRAADRKATDSQGNTPCDLAREESGIFNGTPVLGRLCQP